MIANDPVLLCLFCGDPDLPGHPCDGRQGEAEAAGPDADDPILDAEEGERLKAIGMALVDAGASDAFRESALIALETVARRQPYLVSDDVWEMLALHAGEGTKDHRALGPVMRAAQRRGWIEPTDSFQLTAQPLRHRSPVRVWRSLLWSDTSYEGLAI